jgi:hypothetical protein
MFGLLQPDVQTNASFFFSRQRRVRAEYDYVCSRIGTEPFKGFFRKAVFVGQGEFSFGARHVLTRDHTQGAISGELGTEHFRKGRREPVVLGTSRQIAKTHYGYRSSNVYWSKVGLGRSLIFDPGPRKAEAISGTTDH